MFEKHIDFHADGAARDAEQRRAFAWGELSARLAAVRDARAVLGRATAPSGGSFRRAGALALDRTGQDEGAVNPNGLGGGKANGAEVAAVATDAQNVDREAE